LSAVELEIRAWMTGHSTAFCPYVTTGIGHPCPKQKQGPSKSFEAFPRKRERFHHTAQKVRLANGELGLAIAQRSWVPDHGWVKILGVRKAESGLKGPALFHFTVGGCVLPREPQIGNGGRQVNADFGRISPGLLRRGMNKCPRKLGRKSLKESCLRKLADESRPATANQRGGPAVSPCFERGNTEKAVKPPSGLGACLDLV